MTSELRPLRNWIANAECAVVRDADSRTVCVVHGDNPVADTHLIAAAPDLLAALDEMLFWHGKPRLGEWNSKEAHAQVCAVERRALLAIKKATKA